MARPTRLRSSSAASPRAMRTQTAEDAGGSTERVGAGPVAPDATDSPKTGAEPLSRLALPLRADGTIAVDRMRPATRDQLIGAIRDPALGRALGLTDAAQPAVSLPPQLILPVVHALSQLDTLLCSRLTGAPADLVLRIAPYTPEERDAIAPALAAVLNKHAGPWLTVWGEETALALLLVSLTTAKVQALQDAMKARPRPIHVEWPASGSDRIRLDESEPDTAPSESVGE